MAHEPCSPSSPLRAGGDAAADGSGTVRGSGGPVAFAFLMAGERSGSNLLTRMVDAHPQCCGPAPLHALRILAPRLPVYGALDAEPAWQALIEHLLGLWDAKLGPWTTRPSAALLRSVRPRSLAALVRSLYETEARAQGKRLVLVKEVGLHRFVAYLLVHFPQARFIHLVRDPRDVAASWKASPSHRGGVLRAVGRWCEEQAAALQLRAWLGEAGRIHGLRYEDLIARPEHELRAVCRFLGAEFHPRMLAFHRQAQTRRMAARADNWRNLDRPLQTGRVGRYRELLSEDECRYVEGRCAPLMQAFGYLPEHGTTDDLEALEARLACLEPVDKPSYRNLGADERRRRARWERVVRAIERYAAEGVHDPAGAAA